MVTGIIGRKMGMTQRFTADGNVVPITAVEAGPCVVIQVKTDANDGYTAVQLGFGTSKRLNSAEKGQVKELGQFRHLKEVRVDKTDDVSVGQKIDISFLKQGDMVAVTGISKGKGYAGVVKRHHFHGGPKTHGQSDRTRRPGAIGSTTDPGRVLKGMRMSGHMGLEQVTVRNLEVFQSDAEHNVLFIKGALPGYRNSLLVIRKTGDAKVKKVTVEVKEKGANTST